MRMLLPVILIILGLAGGAAAGYFLKPAPPPDAKAGGAAEDGMETGDPKAETDSAWVARVDNPEAQKAVDSEYVSFDRQFLVPIRAQNGKRSIVALDLNLEIAPGESQPVTDHKPKVRDALLRTLMSFSATGAFADTADPHATFEDLRRELLATAQRVLGERVRSVLIGDMVKQDV